MGFLLYNVKKKSKEGMAHLEKAIRLDPDDAFAHHDLGMALLHQRKFDQAVRHLSEALRRMPQGFDKQYNAIDMHQNLGLAWFYSGKFKDSTAHLSEAVRLAPGNGKLHYGLALTLVAEGNSDDALSHYSEAISLQPDIDKSPILHHLLAESYAKAGLFRKAILSAEKALNLAHATGEQRLAQKIRERIGFYEQQEIRQRMELYK